MEKAGFRKNRRKIKARRRKRTRIGLSLLIVVVVGITCVNIITESQSDLESSLEQVVEAKEQSITGEVIVRDGDIKVSDEIAETIKTFFTDNFISLANLESVDITKQFEKPESENALLNQAALDYMVNLRKAQSNDLTMISYLCGLTFVDVDENFEEVVVVVHEDHRINFSFLPEVDSSSSGIEHTFVLEKTDNGYKISQHYKEEDSFLMIAEWVDDYGVEPYQAGEELLELADKAVASNNSEKEIFNNDQAEGSNVQFENEYDREAAIEYAMNWVDPIDVIRNENNYGVYDSYGGNCNNYISQCLFAGGIPMDTQGDLYEQWKWYGEEVNAYGEYGRSPSFTGVNEFYLYAEENTGFGLEAVVDENLFSGQKGDILQYGYDDGWYHSVIITDVIENEDGEVVDYLINSNTTDRTNYPASAYGYAQMRLIKIIGWNES